MLLELGDVFDWHREGESGHVEGFYVFAVVVNSIWVNCTRIKGCQDGPDETFRVGGVLDIHNSSFLGQPLGCGNVTGAM